jgi:fatty-acyl-CoA synthase
MKNAFLETILDRAKRNPSGQFAEVWKGVERTTLSWSDLVLQASRYSQLLRAQGVIEGNVVFIVFKHGAELYPAFLGTMLAGAIPSFLPFPTVKQNHETYWRAHYAIFKRTSAACVVTYSALKDDLERACGGLATRVVTPDDLASGEQEIAPTIQPGTATALLQHSSGTTGLKKGVALSYDTIVAQLTAYQHALGIEPRKVNTCVASWLPLYHDMGLVTSFLMPMYFGFRLISIDAFEWLAQPSQLFEAIESSQADLVWLPNFAFNHLARAVSKKRQFDLSHVSAFINCSEPCKAASFDVFLRRFEAEGVTDRQLQVCYAMAETTFAVTQSTLQNPVRRFNVSLHKMLQEHRVEPAVPGELSSSLLSNGRPIEGTRVKIVVEGSDLGNRQIGEILVQSTSLFSGYFADAARTATSFEGDWYKTGDLGFVDDGELFVIGRCKDTIIINGRNFYAHDIEAVLSDIEGVKPGRATAFGVYVRARGSEQIVVVAEAEANCEKTALPSIITGTVERTFGIIPGDVRIVDAGWLVKTTSGKISRSANIEKYLSSFSVDAEPIITLEKEN